jgi:Acetyl-CoA carboxylase, carboxyltransferase component (subunits alpha and beta)
MDLQKRQAQLETAKKEITFCDKTALTKISGEGKFTARERMETLFDNGTFVETASYIKARANEFNTAKVEQYEGVITGYGSIDGRLVFCYSQDISRLNGAFGKAAAEKISLLYDLALKNGAPVVSVFDSSGAKLLEGIDVLDGYGKVMRKSASIKGKLPQISVICGNASGAAAIISSMSDIVIMSHKNASYSVNPVSVLQNDGAGKNAGSAEYASEKGFVCTVCEDETQSLEKVKEFLAYLPSNKLDKNIYLSEDDSANRQADGLEALVSNGKYDMHSVISTIADDGKYLELYAQNGTSMICALISLNGIPCGVVANAPSVNSLIGADGTRKAAEFIQFCNSFSLPVLTLVDCEGFSSTCEAKGGRLVSGASALAFAYASASIPLITLNIGAAYGSAFAVLGSKSVGADIVFALNSAKISVMNPASAINFMWNDRIAAANTPAETKKKLEEEWELNMSSPIIAAQNGYIDDIIDYKETRQRLASALEMLSMKSEFQALK